MRRVGWVDIVRYEVGQLAEEWNTWELLRSTP